MNKLLNTDLYQITMAAAYWERGVHNQRASFDLFFRSNPFGNGYGIAAGIGDFLEWADAFGFSSEEIDYLGTINGADDKPLFKPEFLNFLAGLKFSCDVMAVPEGRVVFPNAPLVRVTGPVVQAQLLETPLLNAINFQTLIATKAARVCLAADGDPVLEFGLRRAHGIDGGLSVARAAYIGGVDATSNVLAAKTFGIPVKGTHAHSWVMFFDAEKESFRAYADAFPNNSVFLVDTYDTVRGVERAIEVGNEMRDAGHTFGGIRLDSGDLAFLSNVARNMLNDAGFQNAKIVASNNLDEHVIQSLKQQGATIDVWGVGTKLATAYDQPALGGVYKLCAVQDANGWRDTLKISEQALKVNNPGLHKVRRYFDGQYFAGDLIYDERDTPSPTIVDAADVTRRKEMPSDFEELLVPLFKDGHRQPYDSSLAAARSRRANDLKQLHPSVTRFMNPHEYPVGLDLQLHERKTALMLETRTRHASE